MIQHIAFDLNNSDHVDFSEMIIGLTILTNPEVNERLTWMFRFFDQNKDDFIDDEELKLAIKVSYFIVCQIKFL